jgi:hypothetical protein
MNINLPQIVADMKAAAERATPGDWIVDFREGVHFVRTTYRDDKGRRITAWIAQCSSGGQPNDANSAFIATCHPANILTFIADWEAKRDAELQLLQRVGELEIEMKQALKIITKEFEP